jgi:hypothetical protein
VSHLRESVEQAAGGRGRSVGERCGGCHMSKE